MTNNLQVIPGQKIWTHKKVVDVSQFVTTTTHSYLDMLVCGIPANHIIVSIKVEVLTNFYAAGNSVYVYVTEPDVLTAPINNTTSHPLLTGVSDTYGMALLTIPSGSGSSYEYGTFRWFSMSSPGTSTFAKYGLAGNPTNGSLCIPKRFDAHDVMARFCIMVGTGMPGSPVTAYTTIAGTVTPLALSTVNTGQCEITVQYMSV